MKNDVRKNIWMRTCTTKKQIKMQIHKRILTYDTNKNIDEITGRYKYFARRKKPT